MVDNIGKDDFDFSKYFSLFSSIQSSVREAVKTIIISSFEDVKHVSKGRNALVNRFCYSTYSSKPWPEFMDLIAKRYDFSKIKNICLLGDGGSWIKSGTNELRLDVNNSVKFYLCEFHFKQAIHHITSDKDERNNLIDNIINNYSSIKSMLKLNIGSSMKNHILHLIVSLFAARPKWFSTKRINKYL